MCPSRRQLFEDSSPHSDALTLGWIAAWIAGIRRMSRAARRCTHSTVHGAPVEAATPVFRRTAGAAASGRQASYVPEVMQHATWDMALRIMKTYKSQTCILESTCQDVGSYYSTTYGCYSRLRSCETNTAGLQPKTGREDDGSERRAERMCSSAHGAPPNRPSRRGHARRGGRRRSGSSRRPRAR